MRELAGTSGITWVPSGVGWSLGIRRFYSSLLEHAGVPFLVVAGDATVESDRTVRLEDSPIAWSVCSTNDGAAGPRILSDGSGSFRDHLDGVAGTRRARIVVGSNGQVASTEILLTNPWRWHWAKDLLHPLAALSLPNDGTVRQIVQIARREQESTAAPVVEKLFVCLRDRFRIEYTTPAIEEIAGAVPLQILRAPYQVIFDVRTRMGEGSCIDLVLLLAGCLEAAGAAPIVILLPDHTGCPTHAMLGWWRDRHGGYRPVIEGGELVRRVAAGEVDLLETTRTCVGKASDFAEAVEEARARFRVAPDAVGIDIIATRPPIGSTTPFESSLDPFVLEAMRISESAAHQAGSMVFETIHLFLGLVRAGGPIGCRILEDAGIDPDHLAELCEQEVRLRVRTDHGGRTRGYQRSLDEASANARSQGISVVRECDLWWAVLLGGSASFAGIEQRRPEIRRRLLVALEGISPSSRPGSTLA